MGRYAGKPLGSRCWIVGAVVGLALVLAHPVNAAAQEALTATVTRVIDGDTVEVQLASGAPTTVRLLGIDAPKSLLAFSTLTETRERAA